MTEEINTTPENIPVQDTSKLFEVFFLNADANDKDPQNSTFYTVYPELTFKSRFEQIKETLNSQHGIITMSEVLTENKQLLSSYFANREGYALQYNKYNQDKDSLNYMIAWPREIYNVEFLQQVYITNNNTSLTPSLSAIISENYKREHAFDEDHERSFPIYLVTHLASGEKILLSLVHLGLSETHRSKASELIRECVYSYRYKMNISYPFYMIGGWNGFVFGSDQYNQHQFDRLALEYISIGDLVHNGCKSTFNAFPNNIHRFMRHKEIVEESRLKTELTLAIENKDFEQRDAKIQELRQFHNTVIQNTERKPNIKVSLRGVEHTLDPDVRKGLIIDLVVGWNIGATKSKPHTTCLESKGESDHNPIVLTIRR